MSNQIPKNQHNPKIEIIVSEGAEYQNHKENIYCSSAFFHQSYRWAIACVENILQVAQKYQLSSEPLDISDSNRTLSDQLLGYPNNVIAFCAERGQGKTSAMISFAHALSQLTVKQNQTNWREIYSTDALAPEYQFEVLNSVDPSSMRDQQSILEVILSRLLIRFQDYWDQNCDNSFFRNNDQQLYNQQKLLQYFQDCYRGLRVPDQAQQDDEDLEYMMRLGEGGNIRGALYRLISTFLDYVTGTNKSYLVLQIDDADLSLGDTFQLIDQMRRNLMMPRVIILLSANMFQLESTVEQHFICQYKESIRTGGMVAVETCHNIAARYMDKVIPSSRQIYLPDLGKLVAREFDHIKVKYESQSDQANLLPEGSHKELRYQDQLLQLLYSRTGLVLLNPKTHLHNLLPGNLRELTHFLPYFYEMKPLDIGYKGLIDSIYKEGAPNPDAIDQWLRNLDRLKVYLLDIWAPVSLRTEGQLFLRGAFQYGDANLHRYVLDFLPDYYANERLRSGTQLGSTPTSDKDCRQQFEKRCSERGLKYYSDKNIRYATYADVIEALNVLSGLPGAQRQYKFIYAIRLYYSIRLHQLMLEGVRDRNSQELTEFLGDVLRRQENLEDTQARIRYGHYTLKSTDLFKCLQRLYSSGNINQQATMTVNLFCRQETTRHGLYYAGPIDLDSLKESTYDVPLKFHMFYPCLRYLELLTGNVSESIREIIKQDDSQQDCILGCMLILLNWDVQYMLSKGFRDEPDSSTSSRALLTHSIRSTYYTSTAITKMFESIHYATGKELKPNLFKYFDANEEPEKGTKGPPPEKDGTQETSPGKDGAQDISQEKAGDGTKPQNCLLKEAIYAIQFCIPELRSYLLNSCRDTIASIKPEIASSLYPAIQEFAKQMPDFKQDEASSEKIDELAQKGGIISSDDSANIHNVYLSIQSATSLLKIIGQLINCPPDQQQELISMPISQLETYLAELESKIDELLAEETKSTSPSDPQAQTAEKNLELNTALIQLIEQVHAFFSDPSMKVRHFSPEKPEKS